MYTQWPCFWPPFQNNKHAFFRSINESVYAAYICVQGYLLGLTLGGNTVICFLLQNSHTTELVFDSGQFGHFCNQCKSDTCRIIQVMHPKRGHGINAACKRTTCRCLQCMFGKVQRADPAPRLCMSCSLQGRG